MSIAYAWPLDFDGARALVNAKIDIGLRRTEGLKKKNIPKDLRTISRSNGLWRIAR
jgi:hypothetical protein